MPPLVIHAEIRSQNPDTMRKFFADLFGRKVASEGGFPGYTFIDTGAGRRGGVVITPTHPGVRAAAARDLVVHGHWSGAAVSDARRGPTHRVRCRTARWGTR